VSSSGRGHITAVGESRLLDGALRSTNVFLKRKLVSFGAADPPAQSRNARGESFALDSAVLLAAIAGFATFVFHVATSGAYGYHRDELYYISCARHLAWGYVDLPPLSPVIIKVALSVFGDSLTGLRLLPALAAAATVVLSGRIARRLGGGLVAQGLAMLALALAPFYLAVGNIMTMNAFEPLLWVSAAYLFMKAESDDRPLRWLALGIVVGLGCLNKDSMFLFMGSACIGIAFTPQRRAFARPGFWLAVAVALALVAPSLAWQSAHGWPHVEVLRNKAAGLNTTLDPATFYLWQILMMGPLSAPLWIAGLWFVFSPGGARLRWFGLTYFILLLVHLALQAKVYYLAPIYPVLIAAGSVVIERALRPRRWLAVAYASVLLVAGLVIAPTAFPLLPLKTFIAYQRIFDMRGIMMERRPVGIVPEQFADEFGWDSLVDTMAAAYRRIPADQRAQAVFLASNYGQAGALDFFGPKRGLPPALSGHLNYFLYGTRGASGNVVLAIGLDPRLLRTQWKSVVRVATYHDDYVLPDDNDLAIYLCTRPVGDFAAWWPRTRRYI